MRTPVAFLVFNRPECTDRVFARIRETKPETLFLIADGPRPGHPTDSEQVKKTRALIENAIDWDCELVRDYADSNLGCRDRISSGLNNVFQQVEEAIILEDDCLPLPSFFPFCEELLARYRDERRIMMISGFTEAPAKTVAPPASYFFSRNIHVWGWATWRRAWSYYDVDMASWPEVRDQRMLWRWLTSNQNPSFWQDALQDVFAGRNNTWDWQWNLTCWQHNGLSILPATNLIENIGYGSEATHTTSKKNIRRIKTTDMTFPLRHPTSISADNSLNYRPSVVPSFGRHFLRKLKRSLSKASGA